MSRPVEELLEFDKLKEIVSHFTTCAPGRRHTQELGPGQDRAPLEAEFALIREAVEYLRAGSELGFGSLADPGEWLPQLALATSVLATADLLHVASLAETAGGVRQTFKDLPSKYPRMAEEAAGLSDLRHLSSAIRRAVLPNGEISDNASPHLKRTRAGIGLARENIQRSLEAILHARGQSSGADYVTLRNDRFVIPVRAAERRAVPGVVHAASATGQTVFVEPLEAIDLNNRLVQLREDEAAEIARILAELTEQVRAERSALEDAAGVIGHLDSVFARARFAREFDCGIPEFANEVSLRLEAARNPVLESALKPQSRKAVPLSLALGDAETVLVVSGPNTGGKTVALKTVGLAALSAQSGIPVAAQIAEMPLFDRVLVDIGDEQSITADLSTFSAHMLNLKAMLEEATGHSLVLVDEMGTGTAPEEGAALAVALLEEFRQRRVLTLATTHHDRLKAYASTTPGILNAAMEFDTLNLRPTYKLLIGVPGASSGIEIARRIGLPDRVVRRAEAGLSPESKEARDLIAYLHHSRDELEKIRAEVRAELAGLETERRALQTEWIERQKKRIAELEKNFLETQKRLEAEVARLVAEVKDRGARQQAEKESVRRIRKIAADARAETDAAVVEALASSQADLGVSAGEKGEPLDASQLSAGDRIEVRGFKQAVVFRRHDGRAAEVEAGPLRMKIPLTDILAIREKFGGTGGPGPAKSRAQGLTVHARSSAELPAEEINVIGCTVEEATRRVDKFLDEAVLAGKANVRIIHGYGTGALRRGLGEFLSAHPLVEGTHPEAEDRGGNAVTVAELKP